MANEQFTTGKVIDLIQKDGIELFFETSTLTAFCTFRKGEHKESWPVQSDETRGYIYALILERLKSYITKRMLDEVMSALELTCKHQAKKIEANLRMASTPSRDEFFYDLTDPEWKSIKISADGWYRMTPDILFMRVSHMKEQVCPTSQNADVMRVLNFVNIRDEDQLIFLCWLIASFVPHIQHPILLLTGSKGSAKTTCTQMIRSLVDPSSRTLISLPKTEDNLVALAKHHWMLSFDNVSEFKQEMSDAFCRMSTGGSYEKRKLYTDFNLIGLEYKREVIINGISPPVKNPDLIDRLVWMELEPISKRARKNGDEFLKSFEYYKPEFLGGIFDVLSKAMGVYKTIDRENLHRMADFDVWARAIAVALGYTVENFIEAYDSNMRKLKRYALTQDPVGVAVVDFVNARAGQSWEGTSTDLLKRLTATQSQPVRISHTWPKTSAHLSCRLENLKDELLEAGIIFDRRHTGQERKLLLKSIETGRGGDDQIQTP